MAKRAMNNIEKANAKLLKDKGFNVFWFDGGPSSSGFYAYHVKLVSQYCLNTATNYALRDIEALAKATSPNTETIVTKDQLNFGF
jgi:hypothetical protein